MEKPDGEKERRRQLEELEREVEESAPSVRGRRLRTATSKSFASKSPNCAASSIPIWAPGSARSWRAIRSGLTRSISSACFSPISPNCTATAPLATIPPSSRGFARFKGRHVLVLGHQKGRDTKQRVARNFGQAKPEGYRKALRLMQLAAKFGRPIFTFVDTPGAYPGLDAEERGQAEAIAVNLRDMSRLPVPIIVTITGEGGSGGALAIAVGDQVNMLENSVYSVISPEGCASILWRDAGKAELAAEALRITAQDLSDFGIIDKIVPEPEGGAHNDHEAAAQMLEPVLVRALDDLCAKPVPELLERRYAKFRRMGQLVGAVSG